MIQANGVISRAASLQPAGVGSQVGILARLNGFSIYSLALYAMTANTNCSAKRISPFTTLYPDGAHLRPVHPKKEIGRSNASETRVRLRSSRALVRFDAKQISR